MLIPAGTIILVTDGARLRLYRNEGSAAAPRLVQEDGLEVRLPSTARLGDDKPGRTFSSYGTGRSAYETADLHDVAETQFAEEAAERVRKLVEAGEKVLLAAAPRTLGHMRKTLGPEVRGRLLAELDADYTKTPPDELAERLKSLEAAEANAQR